MDDNMLDLRDVWRDLGQTNLPRDVRKAILLGVIAFAMVGPHVWPIRDENDQPIANNLDEFIAWAEG